MDHILHYVLHVVLEYLDYATGVLQKYVKENDDLHFGHLLSTEKDNDLLFQLRNGKNAGLSLTLKYTQRFCNDIEKRLKKD